MCYSVCEGFVVWKLITVHGIMASIAGGLCPSQNKQQAFQLFSMLHPCLYCSLPATRKLATCFG